MTARLRERYTKEVVPALTKEFGYKNVMAVPRIHKVVVNMGLGEATSNAKIVDTGADELARITGQKAVTRRSKKSIAAFKVRKGIPNRPRGAETVAVYRDAVSRFVTGARSESRENTMATTAKIAKEQKKPKFRIRLRNRCRLCGRPRGYMRKFALCRLCFRKLALEGDVTGVTKSSW